MYRAAVTAVQIEQEWKRGKCIILQNAADTPRQTQGYLGTLVKPNNKPYGQYS